MNENVADALMYYLMAEFALTPMTAYKATKEKEIGLAYTTLDETQPDGTELCEVHEMQVTLYPDTRTVTYSIDDKEVHRITLKDDDELYDFILDNDFQDYYSMTLEHAPDNYH